MYAPPFTLISPNNLVMDVSINTHIEPYQHGKLVFSRSACWSPDLWPHMSTTTGCFHRITYIEVQTVFALRGTESWIRLLRARVTKLRGILNLSMRRWNDQGNGCFEAQTADWRFRKAYTEPFVGVVRGARGHATESSCGS